MVGTSPRRAVLYVALHEAAMGEQPLPGALGDVVVVHGVLHHAVFVSAAGQLEDRCRGTGRDLINKSHDRILRGLEEELSRRRDLGQEVNEPPAVLVRSPNKGVCSQIASGA